MLLLTELHKWYIEQRSAVDRVCCMIEFGHAPILRPLDKLVTEGRRAGDTVSADPSQQLLLASTVRLVGNSLYDKTIIDKSKQRNAHFFV